MATAPVNAVVERLRQAVLRDRAAATDGELLESFVARNEEAAFAALVERHGPMVLGVCRRVARDHHDAEDAFQATFLVLARKASSVAPRDRVGNWLYGVAYRTALKARAMATRRRAREQQVAEMPEPEVTSPTPEHDPVPLLDQELNGLPEIYRLPILLCDLEGKSIKEATRQLGWPQGTVAGRLARGRKLLAKRLANRGVVLSAGSLASVVSRDLASAGVPAALVVSTVKAAILIAGGRATLVGAVPVEVAVLTEGVMKAMMIAKLKTALLVALTVAVAAVGTGGVLYQTRAGEPQVGSPLVVPPVRAPEPDRNLLPTGKDDLLPRPLTDEELRSRYAKLHEELSRHMTAPQVKQKVDELEKELVAVKEREKKALREKQAAEELEKVRAMLTNLAKTYPDTAAGAQARQTLERPPFAGVPLFPVSNDPGTPPLVPVNISGPISQ